MADLRADLMWRSTAYYPQQSQQAVKRHYTVGGRSLDGCPLGSICRSNLETTDSAPNGYPLQRLFPAAGIGAFVYDKRGTGESGGHCK
jgi:hypothetical protein